MDNVTSVPTTLERKEDLGTSPSAVARRWKLEIKLASKREEAWRKKGSEIYKTYAPETSGANTFNILWSNTETLRQACYNSLPQPDVRRRYSDEDPIGKAVGEVLTRCLEFSQDTYDFDGLLKGDVLTMLLPGRSVSRVRYVPDIRQIGGEDSEADDDTQEDVYEEIAWEQAICEKVQWDDFRILCAAKTWDEVTAIGFRHRLGREELVEKFGEEIGNAIQLDTVDDEDVKKSKDVEDLFKTAEVWEIWDKDEKEVIWVAQSHPVPCKTQADPMGLSGFFPVPRPLYAIENDQSLVPTPLYSQYEQQAKELNRVSTRINKLIDALKVRGIYDATLTELSELMKASDNELIGAQNATALIERGGLEKAIWMMPIETAAMVLKELYAQREATKQVIYEISGISDILRAATDANETFGAQKIKAQWGSQRLQKLQREVQRYIRDLIRLKAEVISEKFQPETLEKMTLLQYPHREQVQAQFQQQVQQWQMQAMQAQQTGQQPPPPPQMPKVMTWEDIVDAMHDDATRTYRVDIETDSTIAATQESDMEGLTKLLGGISQLIQGLGPAVQAGAIPVEAVKAIIGVAVRRAKMGTAVEDALEKMQQPAPQADPNAAKIQADQQAQQAQMQHEAQLEQMKGQQTAQLEQMKAQLEDQKHQREMQTNLQMKQAETEAEMKLEQWRQQQQAMQVQHQNELEAQRAAHDASLKAAAEERKQAMDAAAEQAKQEREAALEAQRIAFEERQHQAKLDMEKYKAELDYRKAIEVAELSAKTTLQAAQASAAAQAAKGEEVKDSKPVVPDVHIHMPSGKRTIKKNTDGSYTASDE